jgi:hypothetical protein
MPEEIKVIHVCDREGDMYELFEKAHKTKQTFLIRLTHNRPADENVKVIDTIKKEPANGRMEVTIPRNSRDNTKERRTILEITHRQFNIKKPRNLINNQDLLDLIPITIVYIKEKTKDENEEKIEWILGTNEQINSFEDACKMVKYYGTRWKIERFHYVLKSGCNVEKIQERTVDKTVMLVLMYSIIAAFIMNLTYIARNNPDLPCDAVFDEQE